ncbi:MgtC/SapB family protein [Pusillimonas sp. DMV24BSW_D]|uniref:MgtC/SapB family protein n=1 Tax=Neopusillimonas aestuarii TaxID=2716226 RepID=UPI00140DF115|nr:MgtC/SapB family protein [Pusillimonas sp. DMV24BSW_D]QIM47833.1 MgtC/SapB family protein [Pusillimonas sp. DMV24BSW_D]
MQAFAYFETAPFLDSLVSLIAAFILGGAIGLERQFRLRTAGLRTNVLVAVGAALFVDTAMRFHQIHGGSPGTLQVLAYVVSGVGFLGAGVIMREQGNVRGINTAATLWGSAAVGCAAGADLLPEAILGALFVLAANTLLRPAVNRINRRPLHPDEVEVTYSIHVITDESQSNAVLSALEKALGAVGLPFRDMEIKAFGEQRTEIETSLLPVSLQGTELDTLMGKMKKTPGVQQVFWRASTTV